jgi:mannose-6-phosphate isomerase-like protein (cupin superfamily)
MKILSLLALMTFALPALAQTTPNAHVFPDASVTHQLSDVAQRAKATGAASDTLADYGADKLMLAARTATGGAEVHAHFEDIFIVTEGAATLITNGTVIDPQTNASGETKGASIQNGDSQPLAKGDIIHIPAGVPHQMILAPNTVFKYIVIKVKV